MFKAKTAALGALAKKYPERIKLLETLLNDKTIVYIDFGNVSWSRRLGWEIDLEKLKDFLDSFGITEVRFYFGTSPGHDGSARFMTFVHRTGYKVRTKPVKTVLPQLEMERAFVR